MGPGDCAEGGQPGDAGAGALERVGARGYDAQGGDDAQEVRAGARRGGQATTNPGHCAAAAGAGQVKIDEKRRLTAEHAESAERNMGR